jgi:hypothetical protein
MPIKPSWKIAAGAGTTAAVLAGFGVTAAAANGAIDLRDQGGPVQVEPVDLVSDGSAESADSPAESPFDSAGSPAGAKQAGTADSASSPAPARTQAPKQSGGDSASSADSSD